MGERATARLSVAARRVFLGWDRPLLHAAADWLVDTLGEQLAEHVLVVPGRRAGRRLLELLVDRLPDGRPPRIVTAGALPDELVGERGPVAGRLTRTLAWAAALQALPAERLAELVPHAPPRDDLPSWRELGALARGLHGVLAAADRGFADAIEPAARLGGPGEARRWRALARAHDLYLERLAEIGLADPHESRRFAVAARELRRDAKVVLIGVVEAGGAEATPHDGRPAGLLRATLAALEQPPVALVFAPESEASRFDALGCVRPLAADDGLPTVPVDDGRWWIEDRPSDQAERVLRLLSDPGRARPASEITVGLLEPSVGPPLAARLGEHGVVVRDVAGTPLPRTAPLRLLAATAAWLDGRGIEAFAALVRHPDLALEQAAGGRCLATDLDEYRAAHLPAEGRAPWLALGAELDEQSASARERHEAFDERDRRRALLAATRAWQQQLGELHDGRARPLAQWAEPLRAWLAAVYGERELQPEASERDRVAAFTLEQLGRALDELAVSSGWSAPVSAAVALGELHAALATAVVPPPPRDDAIELLGWLELPLDDAPLLLLTGVNDGHLPEPVGDDPFLTEALATELGLPDDRARLARDAYLLTAVLHSRAETLLLTGRRSQENEPLRPSRLLFACDDERLLARVAALVAAGRRRPPPAEMPAPGAEARALPMAPVERAAPASDDAPRRPERFSPSAFKQYLASPYRYYLERVLRLDGAADQANEMDPLLFGSLAHAVLEGLAHDAAGASTDARRVESFLHERLASLAAERFGRTPLPAVTLQLQQLRARLSAFARWQAEWVGKGWRIRHAEWRPTEPVMVDVDGAPFELTGVIDRIDEHEAAGVWAILDYKTSESAARPESAHRRAGRWVDLQLPLYRELVGELGLPEPERAGEAWLPDPVRLGYVNLPADPADVGARFVPTEAKGRRELWTPELLATALDTARDVVRAVRAGKFSELGDVVHPMADEPLVRALAGLDLLDAAEPPPLDDDDDDTDGGDGGEGTSP